MYEIYQMSVPPHPPNIHAAVSAPLAPVHVAAPLPPYPVSQATDTVSPVDPGAPPPAWSLLGTVRAPQDAAETSAKMRLMLLETCHIQVDSSCFTIMQLEAKKNAKIYSQNLNN